MGTRPAGNHPFTTNLLTANMARLDLPRTILDRQTELSGRPLGEHPPSNWGTRGTNTFFLDTSQVERHSGQHKAGGAEN